MIKSIKQYAITIVIIFVILIINVMAYFQYSNNISDQLQQQTDLHLQAIIEETVECLNIKMEERLETYKSVATFVANLDNISVENIERALEKQSDAAGYRDFDVISAEGVGLESKGSVDYTENSSFNKALGGKSMMEPKTDVFGSIRGINYYVPICQNDKVIGVLMIFSTLEQFTAYTDISDLKIS